MNLLYRTKHSIGGLWDLVTKSKILQNVDPNTEAETLGYLIANFITDYAEALVNDEVGYNYFEVLKKILAIINKNVK